MPLVSVIIPVYKCEDYIEKTVGSLLAQKHCDLQIILVDDGSPDGSGKICDKLADNNERITVIHKSNGGPASAVQAGVHDANGEYICFVDGDDTVTEDYVSSMLTHMTETGSDLAVTGFIGVSGDKRSNINAFKVPAGVYDFEKIKSDIFPKLLMGDRFTDRSVSFSRCGKLFRSDLLKSIIDEATVHVFHGEDGFMLRSYILKCRKIVLVNEYNYYYVKSNANSITTRSDRHFFDQAKILYQKNAVVFAEYKEFDFTPQNEKFINAAAYISIRELWHCFGNENSDAIKKRIRDIVTDGAISRESDFVSTDKLEARMTKYVRDGIVNGLYNIIKLMAIKYKQPLKVRPTRIYGYTCVNFGDDLFFRLLAERYPQRKFVLYAPEVYKAIYSDIDNIKVVNRDSLTVRIGNKIKRFSHENRLNKKCGSYILIGGSVYVQRGEGWQNRLNPSKMSAPAGKPFYVISANFGPFESDEYRDYFENVFSTYCDVCFRDSRSAGYFPSLRNVRFAPDAVFTVDPGKTDPDGKYAVVTVVNAYGRDKLKNHADGYYTAIKNTVLALISRGYSVKAVGFCSAEGDMEIIAKLNTDIPETEVYEYKGDIGEVIRLFAHSSFVLASRFHAMILGWVCGKPTLPVVYDEKMRSVMKDCGYEGDFIDAFDPVFREEMLDVEPVDVSVIRNKAADQFSAVDSFLNY